MKRNLIKVVVFVAFVIVASAAVPALEGNTSFLWFVIKHGLLSEVDLATWRDIVISECQCFAAIALSWIAIDKIIFDKTRIIDN